MTTSPSTPDRAVLAHALRCGDAIVNGDGSTDIVWDFLPNDPHAVVMGVYVYRYWDDPTRPQGNSEIVYFGKRAPLALASVVRASTVPT